MSAGNDNVSRLSQSLEKLMLKMQEVDSTCVELCKDISHQELSLIGYIGLMGEVIMREIAGQLETPLSTATWIVDKLVAKKYLKRYNSIEDRRIVKVGLTNKGQKTYELSQKLKISMGGTYIAGSVFKRSIEFYIALGKNHQESQQPCEGLEVGFL